MARDSRDADIPSLRKLQQDEKLSTLLQEDKGTDCMPCRIIGASAFIGLGTYSYFSGRHQLRQQEAAILKSSSRFGMRARQTGITSIAAMLVGLGLWRLIN